MAATLEIVIAGRDQFSGTVGKASVSFASLAKAGLAAGVGISSVEGALQATKRILSASIGAAAAYEHQMAQIRALTGSTKADTDQLSDSIMEMTKELPKSPSELGAGAYFILSSGITDAGDAAKVLNIAAKASVIGLGETQVVADALTTVLNAYGKEAGDAGQVTDVLIQAVKEGKVEGTGFAAVLGRVVPIAAQMGISFEEVAANLATFTRLGVSAEEAATGLRGTLNALLDPSEEAKAVLAGVGLSMDEIRKAVKEKGLAAVLQDLMGLFGDNQEAISALFPEVRGLTNVLATAGVQAETYTEILGNMDTATGNLDRGFNDVSQTTKFKVDKAMNDLNVNLMLMGEELLPAVADAMAVLTEGMILFTGAVKGADAGLGKFGLKLTDVINLKGGLAGKGITELVGVTGDLGGEFGILGKSAEDAGVDLEDFRTKTPDAIAGTAGVGKAVEETAAEFNALAGEVAEVDTKMSDFFKDFQDLARDAVAEILPTQEEFELLADTTQDNADAVERWRKQFGLMETRMGDLKEQLHKATDPEEVARLTRAIADLGVEMAASDDDFPVILSGFDAWRQRISDTAEDYSGFRDNMQVIMDALVSQNVVGIDSIMAVVREQGPTFAANFAQWFRDDPIAAATTVKEIMPGIMGEAAQTAINNVLAETSRFNAAWQTDVIDALNRLPEEKKLAITTTVDPQWWLLQAQLALMQPGLNIPLTMDDLIQAGQIPRQRGGPVSAGTAYRVGEAGPELFIAPTNGTIIPNHAMMATSAMSPGGSVTINVYPREGQSEREVADCVRREFTSLQRRGL